MREQPGASHSQGVCAFGAAVLAMESNIGCVTSTSSSPPRPATELPMLKFKGCIRAAGARCSSCQTVTAHCYQLQQCWGALLLVKQVQVVGPFTCFFMLINMELKGR